MSAGELLLFAIFGYIGTLLIFYRDRNGVSIFFGIFPLLWVFGKIIEPISNTSFDNFEHLFYWLITDPQFLAGYSGILCYFFFKHKWYKTLPVKLLNSMKNSYKSKVEKQKKIKKEMVENSKEKEREELIKERRIHEIELKEIDAKIEKEKTKRHQISANIKEKELEKLRPEKEERLSKILNKLDDL